MNEQIRSILSHKITIPAVAGVVTFGVGFGIGYIRGNSKRGKELHEVPVLNLKEIREPVVLDIPEPEEEDEVYEPLTEPVVEQEVAFMADGEVIEPERRNVFAQSDDTWNYEEELSKRQEGMPYILHADEFFQNEQGWTQLTLTYFEGDDIMVDQDEKPIYNYVQKTGELRFGHGSNDPNVFYVRNSKYRVEYEIIRHQGHYSIEIQGLSMEESEPKPELRHSVEKLKD